MMKLLRYFSFALLFAAVLVLGQSCAVDREEGPDYGHVQFRVLNSIALQTKAEVLENLSDARKIQLVMMRGGYTITQTIPLSCHDAASADYGLQSDKLSLLSGEYTVEGFTLYDALDKALLSVVDVDDKDFTVVPGGLTLKELGAPAKAYGSVSFRLVKDFVQTKSAVGADSPFSRIRLIDITLRNAFSGKEHELRKIMVTSGVCDTLVRLPRGNYRIWSYTTYSDAAGRSVIETRTLGNDAAVFTVEPFASGMRVDVPVKLDADAEYIKDYIALKEIWEALDGPRWSYVGEDYPRGANWNFNCDMDLWGQQPGVNLGADGRVIGINFSGFGVRGDVPDAIGQLTACQVLSFGNHNETVGGSFSASQALSADAGALHALRMDLYHRTQERDAREDMSVPLVEGINSDSSQRPVSKNADRINLKDINFGILTNGITGFSRALARLTNLQQLYIANSPVTIEGFFKDVQPDSPFYGENLDFSALEALTDIEMYNCRNLAGLPLELLTRVPDIQALNVSNNSAISGDRLKADWEAIIDGASGARLQILYLGHSKLREFPPYEKLSKMLKLGFLDCTYSQLETVHPFGAGVTPAKILLDHNSISSITPAPDGYFCGLSQLETFTASYNKLTEAPDIFNAKSINVFDEVDFSHNDITCLAGGGTHRGYNAATINLSYNRFDEFPSQLFKSGSPCQYLIFAGNGLRSLHEGDLMGPKSSRLVSLDLSYNKLSSLPAEDFYSTNLPYLYGVDLSYNCLDYFPVEVLDGKGVTVLALRHQRDDEGNRTLRNWPTGIYGNCPSLQALYLGSNDIGKVGDTVTPQIPILEITDNPNITVNVSSSYCTYWQYGYVLLVYDKTQDIRGCPALLQ